MGETTFTLNSIINRIAIKSIKRIGVQMPRYHRLPDNWGNRGKFEIKAMPFPRNVWPLYLISPYHVGDRVKFTVFFEKQNLHSSNVVFEKFRDTFNKQPICDVNNTRIDVIGSIIDGEGDVSYYIGNYGNPTDSKLIFTTRVESWDTIFSKWGWAIIGAILSYAIGIMSGFIKVRPFWEIWLSR